MQLLVELDRVAELLGGDHSFDEHLGELAVQAALGHAGDDGLVLLVDLVLHEHRRVVGVDVALDLHRGALAIRALRRDARQERLHLGALRLPRRLPASRPVLLEEPVESRKRAISPTSP